MRSKRNKSRTQSKPKGESHLQGAAAADAGGYVAETDSFPDNPPPHEASSAMAGAIAAASAGSAEAALRSVLDRLREIAADHKVLWGLVHCQGGSHN